MPHRQWDKLAMDVSSVLAGLLLVELPLLAWRFRTPGALVRTTVHMMMFVICCQLTFWAYAVDWFPSGRSACYYGSQYRDPAETLLLFSTLFGVFFLSDLICRPARGLGPDARQSLMALSWRAEPYLNIAAWIWVAYLVLYLFMRDWTILWDNSTYLLMIGPSAAVYANSFAYFVSSLATPVYLIACIFAGVTIARGRLGASALFLLVALVFFVLFTSTASRTGAVGVILLAGSYALIRRRLSMGVIVLGVIALYTVLAVLMGRGEREFGIAHFFDVLALPLSEGFDLTLIITNLFQGSLSTADSLLVPGDFSNQYKWLSLSPLPSFIDGFRTIRESSELRLFAFCPMSGAAEIIRFGPLFWPILGLQYAIMVRAINSRFALSRVGVLPVICINLLFTVFSVIGFTYPLRNVLRPMTWACIALIGIALFAGRRRSDRSPTGHAAR